MADQHLVTGISPESEPKKIEDALCARPQVDCSKVNVITGQPPTEEHTASILQFIHSSEYAQTSDVSVTTREMRRLVIFQSVVSFVFNTTILALAINAAAGFF